MGEIIGAAATVAVGLVTVFFAYNYRRQIGLQTAQARIKAYGALWTAMHVARPTRREIDGKVLTRGERFELEAQMSLWYFTEGSGMLLTRDARQMYFGAKRNLVADLDYLEPKLAREHIRALPAGERDEARGALSMRHLSLLRTLMKADLDIYGRIYGEELKPEDEAFIEYCGLDPTARPWRRGRLARLRDRGKVERIAVPPDWRAEPKPATSPQAADPA